MLRIKSTYEALFFVVSYFLTIYIS